MSDFSDYSYLTPPADPVEFDAWLLAQEERIARKTRAALVKIIDEATEAFVNSLTATGDMSYFDSIPMQWAAYVDDVLLEDVQGLFLSGGLAAYATSPSTALLAEGVGEAWVNVVNQSAVDYALEASNRMKDVGQTAWNDIKNKVSDSIEKGTSTDQLRELLRENRRFSEYRAETIARTETANAYNNGDWAGQQALGEYGPTHKYWVNTSDNRTRTSHLEAPNQNKVIPVSQPFIVGGQEMMFPHSPGAPAKEVVNCRCRALYLYPGDTNPFTGEIIGDVGTVTQSQSVQPTATDQLTTQTDVSPFGPGVNGTRKASDIVSMPSAQRGRLLLRSQAISDTTKIIDKIHGMTPSINEIKMIFGGKADRKGGHFSPATRGAKPKRSRTMTYDEWREKVNEYNSRALNGEIKINDFDLDKQMSDMTHELGHATDWDGTNFVSRRAWLSSEAKELQAKYGAKWLDHLDEINDELTAEFLKLGKIIREAESAKTYLKPADFKYRQYFMSVEEVWARSYAQWIAQVAGDSRLTSAMSNLKASSFQFTDEEFKVIGPIIERILRLRGLMK